MKYPKYPKYKDSGMEWIGEIPEHWCLATVSRGYQVTLGKMLQNEAENKTDDLFPYLRASNIQSYGVDFEDVKEMYFSLKEKYKLALKKNDLLVSEGGDAGRSVILEREIDDFLGFQNSINRVRPVGGNNERILHYWLNMLKNSGYIDAICNKATFTHYTAEKLKATPALYPPVNEQTAISHYLIDAIKKIASLISKQQQLIEILKEKRQAIITHAVTKGLDPNVPMKDSGIEWIGKIPQHWDAIPIKFVMSCNDETLPENTHPDTEMQYVEISDVSENKGITNFQEIKFSDAPSRARRIVKDGDIIISTVRTYLRAIATIKEPWKNTVVSTGFAVLRPRSISQNFAKYALSANYFIERIVSESTGVSYPAINSEKLMNFRIVLPDSNSQNDISDYLDKIMSKLGLLIAKQEKMIELLNEHKTSLITQAVTGKIDVRGLIQEVKKPAGQTP